jgi:hypothetical protein
VDRQLVAELQMRNAAQQKELENCARQLAALRQRLAEQADAAARVERDHEEQLQQQARAAAQAHAALQGELDRARTALTQANEQAKAAAAALAKAQADAALVRCQLAEVRAERADTSWFGRWRGHGGEEDAGDGDGGDAMAVAATYKPVGAKRLGSAAGFVVQHQRTGATFMAKMGHFEVGVWVGGCAGGLAGSSVGRTD